MLKSYRYNGTEVLNFGRHGLLKKGAVISCSLKESQCGIAEDPRFEAVAGDTKPDPAALSIALGDFDKEALYEKALELRARGVQLDFNKASSKKHLLTEIRRALNVGEQKNPEEQTKDERKLTEAIKAEAFVGHEGNPQPEAETTTE